MQPLHEQTSDSAAALGCVGAEVWTVFQVTIFIGVGYAATRTWTLFRARNLKVSTKKFDEEIDSAAQPQEHIGCDDIVDDVVVCPQIKARNCNAKERKRTRKASSAKLTEDPVLDSQPEQAVCQLEYKNVPSVLAIEVAPTPQEVVVVGERLSKLMAKKAERKSRKATLQAVEKIVVSFPVNAEKPDSEASSQDGHQTASTPSVVSVGSEPSTFPATMGPNDCSTPDSARSENTKSDNDPATVEVEEKVNLTEISLEIHGKTNLQQQHFAQESELALAMNFDNIESDSDSEMGFVQIASGQVAMPEASQNLLEISNAPLMWPSTTVDEQWVEPQIEWMAVAVPTECAPSGACDGLWKNSADEKILIEKLEIMFESGVTWEMQMHSLTNVSVEVNGEQIYAELDLSGGRLFWSDGDVWTFFGQAGDASECTPQAVTELPIMMSPTAAMEVPCMMMPFAMEESCSMPFHDDATWMPCMMESPIAMQDVPAFQCIPTNAEECEVCWDFAKKGWCPWGAKCEWYHPAPEATNAEECEVCYEWAKKGWCSRDSNCKWSHPSPEASFF